MSHALLHLIFYCESERNDVIEAMSRSEVFSLFSIFLFFLSISCDHVVAQELCKISGNNYCKCTNTNGNLTLDLTRMGLDLPMAKTTQDSGKYNIDYMPCKPAQCPGATGGEPNSVMCQIRADNPTAVFSLGRISGLQWLITDYDPLTFEIHYRGGDGDRLAYVHFKYDASVTTTAFTFDDEDPTKTYNFKVVGSKVAPSTGGGGGGGSKAIIEGPIGIAFILVALIGIVIYFVVGGIYMYQFKGARGAEIIPNYSFWRDLPFLISDGFFFVISPCYTRRGKYQGL